MGLEETVIARELLGAEVVLYFQAQGRNQAVRLKPENETKRGEVSASILTQKSFTLLIWIHRKIYSIRRILLMNKKKKGSLSPYGYLLPCMLIFAVFLFYPFLRRFI